MTLPDISQQELQIAYQWLQRLGKRGVKETEAITIIQAASQGADTVRTALENIGIKIRKMKIHEFDTVHIPDLVTKLSTLRESSRSAATIVLRNTTRKPENVPGPGFPMGRIIKDSNLKVSDKDTNLLVARLDLDNI